MLDSLLTNLINYITQGLITQDMELNYVKTLYEGHFHLIHIHFHEKRYCIGKNLVSKNVEFCIRNVFNPFNVA